MIWLHTVSVWFPCFITTTKSGWYGYRVYRMISADKCLCWLVFFVSCVRDETEKTSSLPPSRWVSRRPFTRRSLFLWLARCLGLGLMPPTEASPILIPVQTTMSPHLRYVVFWTQQYLLSLKSLWILWLTLRLGVCLGGWHRSGTWAFLLWRQEKSGLHLMLQIQRKTGLQAPSLHFIQRGDSASVPGPMGSEGRDAGGRWTRRRHRGLEADGGGKGFNEGGFRSRSGWSRTTDWAWQRGARVFFAVFLLRILSAL